MVNSVLIYASIALITSLFSELSVKVKNKWIRGFCLLLTLFIPSFFAGVRYGIGTDYFAYERIFNNLKCGYEVRTEFGYNLINYLIAKLGGNIQHVFFVVSLLTILFMYLSLYEYKDKISVGLGIFVFMLLYYQSSYNVVRQFLAVSVNGHLKNSIFGHKKTSNFGHEKPAVIQNLSLAITVEELPRRQWSVAERLLGNSHSLSPVKLTCSYCYLSSWLY